MRTGVVRAFRHGGRELSPEIVSGAAPEGARLRVTGVPAVFELIGAMPSGWVEFAVSLGAGDGSEGRARLLADAETGTQSVPLSLRPDGSARTVVRLGQTVRALRLEIHRPGPLDRPAVSVRTLTPGEAALRLAWPLVVRRLREPWTFLASFGKALLALRAGGVRAVVDRMLYKEQRRSPQAWYAEWLRQFDSLDDADRASIRARAARLTTRFSVLLPLHDVPQRWLESAIASVRAQLYPHWELCIAGDASGSAHMRGVLEAAAREDRRIRVSFPPENGHIAAAWKAALALGTGEFIALLGPGGVLAEHALYLLAEGLAAHPDSDLLYGDEDKLDERGTRFDPWFKPDWNPDLLLSQNYVGGFCAFRRTRVLEAGAFREGFEGGEDHDLCLRATRDGRVHRVPFLLYHRHASGGSPAPDASVRAVRDHLGARAAEVLPGPAPGSCRVRWPIPDPAPLVTLIIPTRDRRALLETAVESLLRTTRYRRFELLVVDNQTRDADALSYLSGLRDRGVARVVAFDRPFNFSAINNLGVREARGEVVGLLNNDLEFIEPGWLEEMVSQALRPEVGAVGARLLYPDRTVQHGGIILGIAGLAGHAHKHASAGDSGYFLRAQLVQDVSAVTAACLLVRRETYLAAGGFDEELAVAFNDVDFCLRLQESGLRNLWTPFATLLHHESVSRGAEDTPAKRRRFEEERRLVLKRWGEVIRDDPAYNPNLTFDAEDFSLAWPPRVRKPWL